MDLYRPQYFSISGSHSFNKNILHIYCRSGVWGNRGLRHGPNTLRHLCQRLRSLREKVSPQTFWHTDIQWPAVSGDEKWHYFSHFHSPFWVSQTPNFLYLFFNQFTTFNACHLYRPFTGQKKEPNHGPLEFWNRNLTNCKAHTLPIPPTASESNFTK